jgi:tartrate dehydrogenase/decarboxylase/D-malate dehydrogenase
MGKGVANPIGQIWSGAMMLKHLGEEAAAWTVERAIEKVLQEPGLRTRDMGGTATTRELGDAVAEVVREV